MEYIEIKIKEVIQETSSLGRHRVILEDIDSTMRIPIFISTVDAAPLISIVRGETYQRPRPHDLLLNIIDISGFKLKRINISGFDKGIYLCELLLDGPKGLIKIDSRPSDAFFWHYPGRLRFILKKLSWSE